MPPADIDDGPYGAWVMGDGGRDGGGYGVYLGVLTRSDAQRAAGRGEGGGEEGKGLVDFV